ncbi:MAG: Hint domain-containing protein [Pseudotabrizicola sp.]|uniref:Hint domain-containing protein n=1 Tax=Pseudotabrizicola sp. TaxID=2939647 RepID=UPI0027243D31|nr:Hint domain-containing protein [Pseudotabrizicola sp.]MDO8882994.1 Hint domain-containing protein [Pseudotabrizicola sp.]MDP2081839.1 Hint domain-containing protein [Pseudotabrizicola sp.]MDZ7573871.1 Hint domain-containing protein [Pseudotabrizicola sp.]
MEDWLALSDLTLPNGDRLPLEQGLFICETTLPLGAGTVLLEWHQDDGDRRSFSIFADPQAGIVVLHRNGEMMRRHVLPGPLPFGLGAARITYGWNRRTGRWTLSFGRIGMGEECQNTGIGPIALSPDELAALCRRDGAALRHASLLWFGVTTGARPPERAPWLGLRTPVDTARGPVAAGALRAGDLVHTADNGLQPVLRVSRLNLPSRGSFAPVIMRAPYLGQGSDVLLAADQLVALNGAEVEYMFGVEEVLVRADALANGTIARIDGRQAAIDCVTVDLGLPELLLADGLKLLSHGFRAEPPRPVLLPFEAQQLVSLMARRSLFGAA